MVNPIVELGGAKEDAPAIFVIFGLRLDVAAGGDADNGRSPCTEDEGGLER